MDGHDAERAVAEEQKFHELHLLSESESQEKKHRGSDSASTRARISSDTNQILPWMTVTKATRMRKTTQAVARFRSSRRLRCKKSRFRTRILRHLSIAYVRIGQESAAAPVEDPSEYLGDTDVLMHRSSGLMYGYETCSKGKLQGGHSKIRSGAT